MKLRDGRSIKTQAFWAPVLDAGSLWTRRDVCAHSLVSESASQRSEDASELRLTKACQPLPDPPDPVAERLRRNQERTEVGAARSALP